jgi:hypothetical protein
LLPSKDGDDVPIHEEVDDDDIVRALSFMCNLMYGNGDDFPMPPGFEGDDMALGGDEVMLPFQLLSLLSLYYDG